MKSAILAKRFNPRAWALMALFFLSSCVWSAEVRVPLLLDYALIRHLLLEKVYTAPNHTSRFSDSEKPCNSLVLSNPEIGMDAGRIRIVSAVEASMGDSQDDGRCSKILNWQGFIELLEQPVLAPGLSAVQFSIVDSHLYDRERKRPIVAGVLWDWMKTHVHPHLEPIKVDIGPPLRDIRSLLPLMFSTESAESVKSSLDSLVIADVRAAEQGLAMTLQFNLPETRGQPTAPLPEPALTPDEAQKWEAALERWDAFLTFVIKRAARETELQAVRQALLDVLLEGRYDLSEALTSWSPGSPDPVRRLFIKSWKRLAPVFRQLSTRVPGAQAVQYISFIAAADALEALDQLGEQMGFQISADGLRQLARTLAPQFAEDPLLYSIEVDPELRELFGFGPPLMLPETTPEDESGAWLMIPGAWAAPGPDSAFIKKLNRWIPDRDEIGAYLPLVRDLLKQTIAATLDSSTLEKRFHDVFSRMSLATAWQESCWRQFIKDGGKIKPLTSSAGAIGIMQVNPRVWRGFYDTKSLRRDIGYNATAGNEILLHYLVDYVMAGRKSLKAGDIEHLVRATYAVYNGGPGHLNRYRKKNVAKSLREIDQAFWKKYRTLQKNELAAASCWNIYLSVAPPHAFAFAFQGY